ncbi:MAG TPA: hypothetical protein VKP30_28075 [Polyangiaceae bacterium]|nr:hypothetical protein [Polyangiaceae bacterium]
MSDSDKPINVLLEGLPTSSMTTRLLGLLDYVVPGEWENVTSFERMVMSVTGESDHNLIQQVGERAIMLYNDPSNGYQRAVWIYQMLDDTAGIAGMTALADKLSGSFDFLGFLGNITPKADATQTVDAAVKLVGELSAFCYTNGMPGDSIADFAASFGNAQKEDSMRLAAYLAYDCILPLGPDFLSKLADSMRGLSEGLLSGSGRFARIASYLPTVDLFSSKKLIVDNFEATKGVLEGFAATKGLEQSTIFSKIQGVLGSADHSLDYVAAGIDLVSNHFEHTGIQSVARRVISRAYGEI